VLPITRKEVSQDKVRSEAARIGFSAPDNPKKTHIGSGTGKIGDVKFEPGERDVFADVGGHQAHDLLAPIVNSPTWDEMPDLVKRRVYQQAFKAAHTVAGFAAIPMDKRIRLTQEVSGKMMEALNKRPVKVDAIDSQGNTVKIEQPAGAALQDNEERIDRLRELQQ